MPISAIFRAKSGNFRAMYTQKKRGPNDPPFPKKHTCAVAPVAGFSSYAGV